MSDGLNKQRYNQKKTSERHWMVFVSDKIKTIRLQVPLEIVLLQVLVTHLQQVAGLRCSTRWPTKSESLSARVNTQGTALHDKNDAREKVTTQYGRQQFTCHFTAEIVRVWNSSSSFCDIIVNIWNFLPIKTGLFCYETTYSLSTYVHRHKCINRSFRHSAILGGSFIGGFMIWYDVNRRYDIYIIQGGPKKTGPFLKVCNSCIWWRRKAFNIPKCSALYQK